MVERGAGSQLRVCALSCALGRGMSGDAGVGEEVEVEVASDGCSTAGPCPHKPLPLMDFQAQLEPGNQRNRMSVFREWHLARRETKGEERSW